MSAFYNEHDPYAAAWLRNLIDAGEIAPGVVDERDIQEIDPDELTEYTQVHLFGGLGGWSLALRLAGWPDDRPICTGSCPCQPFSAAGKRKGARDARHLWPWMRHLIFRRRFPVAVGEQVASADGRFWLAGVRGNLETLGYVVGAADLCSPGAGADHIRQRLYWVADAQGHRAARNIRDRQGETGSPARSDESWRATLVGVHGTFSDSAHGGVAGGRLGDTDDARPQGRGAVSERPRERFTRSAGVVVPCLDGKSRRFEPGSFPLAHGLPRRVGPGSTKQQRVELVAAKANRVGRLKGYGNAIDPHVAAEFISAYLDVLEVA